MGWSVDERWINHQYSIVLDFQIPYIQTYNSVAKTCYNQSIFKQKSNTTYVCYVYHVWQLCGNLILNMFLFIFILGTPMWDDTTTLTLPLEPLSFNNIW